MTGAKGMLGSDVCSLLSQREEVIPLGKEDLDVRQVDKVISLLSEIKPDVVVHCAGYTDVDGCELKPQEAYLVNTVGTWAVASACQKMDAVMLYVSTDYVFDGSKGKPYTEIDEPNPLNEYGRSKWGGEKVVQMLLRRFFIIRTAWLYGARGRNFVRTILQKSKETKVLRVVRDQIGSPTYTVDLARAISHLLSSSFYGIYHITNQGAVSWFDFAREIVRLAGLDVEVVPIESSQWRSPARRPPYSALASIAWNAFGFPPMRGWQSALADFLSQIGGA